MNDKAREAFAAWGFAEGLQTKNDDRGMSYPLGDHLWLAWQAALQWAASQQAEVEVPITAPGMVKVGDKIRFTLSDKRETKTVALVLNAGTDKEELIYNKRRNYYIITSMAMAGTGSQKDVCVLRPGAASQQAAPEGWRLAPVEPTPAMKGTS